MEYFTIFLKAVTLMESQVMTMTTTVIVFALYANKWFIYHLYCR